MSFDITRGWDHVEKMHFYNPSIPLPGGNRPRSAMTSLIKAHEEQPNGRAGTGLSLRPRCRSDPKTLLEGGISRLRRKHLVTMMFQENFALSFSKVYLNFVKKFLKYPPRYIIFKIRGRKIF